MEKAKDKDNQEPQPQIGDENWTEYVLSHLTKKELYDGKYPSVNGLRRILNKVLNCKIIQQASDLNAINNVAVVKHTISVVFHEGDVQTERMLSVDGCADATKIDDIYAGYPVAVAESRAEGRALRRLLNIDVVVKEEVAQENLDYEAQAFKIDDLQIAAINKQCKQLKIDPEKFLAVEKQIPIDSLSTIEKSDALCLLEVLSSYISDSSSIPGEILA